MKKKLHLLLPIIASLLVMLSIGIYLSKQFGQIKLNRGITDLKKVSFLLHATGTNDDYLFSSLIHIYPKDKKIGLYFINPLTRFPHEDEPLYKLKSGAIRMVEKELTNITGKKLHYSIHLNYENFIRVIDLFGGLPTYLEPKTKINSIHYIRNINAPYNLTGEDALDYLTTLESNDALSYVHRLERQESAILSFFFHVKKNKEILKKSWIPIISKWVVTNIDLDEWTSLVDFLLTEDWEFGVGELPGEIQKGSKLGEFILQISIDTSKIAFKKFEADILSEFYSDTERSRVEVLNGTTTNGLAKKGKSLLNDRRIKVLSVENAWSDNFKKSIVINRSGNTKISKIVSDAISTEEIYYSIRKELGLDCTVIIGENFAKTN